MNESWLWTTRRKSLSQFFWRHCLVFVLLAVLCGGVGGYVSYNDNYYSPFLCKTEVKFFNKDGEYEFTREPDYSSSRYGELEPKFLRPYMFYVEANFGQELTKREIMQLSSSSRFTYKFCSEGATTIKYGKTEYGKLEPEFRAVRVGKLSSGAIFAFLAPFGLLIFFLILNSSLAILDKGVYTIFRHQRGFRDKTVKWIKDGFDDQDRS